MVLQEIRHLSFEFTSGRRNWLHVPSRQGHELHLEHGQGRDRPPCPWPVEAVEQPS